MDDFTPDEPAAEEKSSPLLKRFLLLVVGVCIAASCFLLSGGIELKGIETTDIQQQEDNQRDNKLVLATEMATKEQQQPHWQAKGQALARIYPSRSVDKNWCIPASTTKKRNREAVGLLFIKIYKCASSTGSSITLNIAHHVAQRLNMNTSACHTVAQHHQTQHLYIPERRKETSFLWTLVRHPAKRVVSHFFFKRVSRDHVEPTNRNMKQYFRENKNFQVDSLQEGSLQNYTLVEVLQELDFVGVVERMDESLVVLQMLLGLQASDIVVLSSKRAGGYDAHKKCHLIQPSFRTNRIDRYLNTAFVQNNLDFVLYAAANASLDKTIDALGRERVEAEVKRHKQLQQVTEEACLEKAAFPCSPKGVYQPELSANSCYAADWGCGHTCVSETLRPFT